MLNIPKKYRFYYSAGDRIRVCKYNKELGAVYDLERWCFIKVMRPNANKLYTQLPLIYFSSI